MSTPLVSVVVPVYNVAAFVEKCVRSLMEQTLSPLELIFVNDCTTDDSMDIVRRVVAECQNKSENQIRIIEHDVNKGLAAARNTGLSVATGKYVFHCDSDDWLESTMLEKLYYAAEESDSDVSYCDFYISFVTNERYMRTGRYVSAEDMIRRGFLSGALKYNVWNKLVKRNVYESNSISFPDGHNMGEDMTMIQVVACSDRVSYVPEALYHYVKLNMGAYSNSHSERHFEDIRFNMERTVSFLNDRYGEKMEKEIALFKLSNKFPFLISSSEEDYKRWQEWYPETDRYVWNKDSSLRVRLLQLAAHWNQFWLLRLHYWLVYKVMYGIIYR